MSEVAGAMPFYVQVAETLKRRILAGEYPADSLLPNAEALEKEFGVSDITVRKALAVLSEDGFVRRKKGLGAIVQKYQRDVFTLGISGSFNRLVQLLEDSSLEMQALEASLVPCPNRVAQMLGFGVGDEVSRFRKVRKYNGKPIGYHIQYCTLPVCRSVRKEDLDKEELLPMLKRIAGEDIELVKQRLEATSADCDLAPTLQVKFGAPLLFVEGLFVSGNGAPVALTDSYYRGDLCSFNVNLTGTQSQVITVRSASGGGSSRIEPVSPPVR